jgi:hypothetical protein
MTRTIGERKCGAWVTRVESVKATILGEFGFINDSKSDFSEIKNAIFNILAKHLWPYVTMSTDQT